MMFAATIAASPDVVPVAAAVTGSSFTLLDLISVVGAASTIVGFIYVGRKLQVLDDLKETVGKIKDNLQVVTTYLTRHHTKFNADELRAFSPLRLTDVGTAFIESSGFAAAFAAHRADFFGYISSESPKQKYDVETAAIKAIYALYEKPYMAFLKTFFYNNPGRNLENTAPTLGVYVRDAYLAEHMEIVA